ncbi:hypothetical protein DFH11DRAFT_1793409 [Phellopilus nigrolimitatus]|nr:hypothetical protein DFH11DRAFT_1793409 [Phellopilus nigrolimitatus]
MKARTLDKVGESERLAAVQELKTNPAKIRCAFSARICVLLTILVVINLSRCATVIHSGLALASIVGIGSMHRFVALGVDPTLSGILTSNWPNLHAWIQYFYMERVSGEFPKVDGETRQTKELVLFTLCDALMTVSCDELFFSKIIFANGVLKLVANLWLKENPKANFSDIFRSRASAVFSACLASADLQNKLALAHEIILKEADGDTEKVVTQALHRLRTVTKINSKIINSLFSCMNVLRYLYGNAKSPFRTPILEKDGVTIITRVFVSLSSVVGSIGLIEEHEVIAMENCLCFVSYYMLARQSPSWTAKTVQSGLLEAIAKSCLMNYSSRGIEVITTILRSLLPLHLAYRSILGAVIRSMKSIESDASLVAKIRSSPFVKDWDYFLDRLFERAAFKAIFDQVSGINNQDYCHYCERKDERDNFKKCAGCRMALYCSRDCQVNDWKLGNHREECKAMTTANDNIKRHSSSILELAKQKFPGVSFTDVVYKADYTTVPPTLDVFSFEDLTSERENVLKLGVESLQMCRRYVQTTQASKGKVILVSVIAPSSEFSGSLYFMTIHADLINVFSKDDSGEANARRMRCCGPDRKDLGVVGGDEVDKVMAGARAWQLRARQVSNSNPSAFTVYDHIEDFVSKMVKFAPAPNSFGVFVSADAMSKG